MLDIMEFIWQFLQKNAYEKSKKMSFIHFMPLKPLIKTTQKCLIFWNLLGIFINKVLVKKSKFMLYSLFFETTQKCLLFSNLLGSFYK